MSMQFAKVLVPPPVSFPRGADWVAELTVALSRVARSVWSQIEVAGHARADSELRRLAVRYAHQPELARMLREAMHGGSQH